MKSLLHLGVASAFLIFALQGCNLSPNIDLPSADGSESGDGDGFTGDGDAISVGDGDNLGPSIDDMGGGSSTCSATAGAGGAPDDCHD